MMQIEPKREETIYVQKLERAEEKIIQLLQLAAESIDILVAMTNPTNDITPVERQRFENYTIKLLKTIKDIQRMMKEQIQGLSDVCLSNYQNSLYGSKKDRDISLMKAHLVSREIASIRDFSRNFLETHQITQNPNEIKPELESKKVILSW
eukprot:TRINITY_DN1818_c0_g1_i1.p1 TRINITY_DN1818_c0_g1~~TRINITY_DN1818_c0_g1_i1.p1  ORF type:complete len:151 (-),score=30.73 TRINITY_DN1818_c0_g1_i1:81-533(-)